MDVLMLELGQTTAPTGGAPNPISGLFPIALMLGLVVFMLLSSRSQKKREQRAKDDMYSRMTRNDRVLTIGGIIGTIMSVKDNEVVLKVDETTNTKMTFLKTSVQRILADEQTAPADKR
jgi:preprotein translocase subunit YajC